MKTLTYETHGTCAKFINIAIDDNGLVADVEFVGGCNGNTTGISQLVRGMKAEDVAKRLEGIRCGFKNTSCPDQLARALRQAVE